MKLDIESLLDRDPSEFEIARFNVSYRRADQRIIGFIADELWSVA